MVFPAVAGHGGVEGPRGLGVEGSTSRSEPAALDRDARLSSTVQDRAMRGLALQQRPALDTTALPPSEPTGLLPIYRGRLPHGAESSSCCTRPPTTARVLSGPTRNVLHGGHMLPWARRKRECSGPPAMLLYMPHWRLLAGTPQIQANLGKSLRLLISTKSGPLPQTRWPLAVTIGQWRACEISEIGAPRARFCPHQRST